MSEFLIVRPFTIDDAALTSSNVTEDDYSAYNSGTTYDAGDRVIVVDTDVHLVFESLQDSNTGNDPLDDPQFPEGEPAYWIRVGATNRWKMFDQKQSSQTVNADSIEVELTITRRPNAIFLGNVAASEIQIVQKDTNGNTVFTQTVSMIESSGQPSYYGWFFQQIQRKTDLLITELAPVAGGTLEISIINDGEDAKCGTCVVGYAEVFGKTQLGAGVGIQDFSVKRQDEFGEFEIRERDYSRVGRFVVFVENSIIDRMQTLLASRRATATLYVAAEQYTCTYIYGFYEDMENVIEYNEYSLFSIRAVGLT
jgi:hypothetical protein